MATENDTDVFSFYVDKRLVTFRRGEMTGLMSAKVRKETGMSFVAVLSLIETDPDMDLVAILVWVSRMQSGETVSFEDVASEINYDTEYDFDGEAEPAEEDSPEA